jgi:hypothetical protein
VKKNSQNMTSDKTQKCSFSMCPFLYQGMPSLGRTASSSPPTALFVAASLSEPIFSPLTSGGPRRPEVDKEFGVQRRPAVVYGISKAMFRQSSRRLQDGQRFRRRLLSRDIVAPSATSSRKLHIRLQTPNLLLSLVRSCAGENSTWS